MTQSLGIFKDQKQGAVTAAGTLAITFTCPLNQKWIVSQVSYEMPTAPAGSSAILRQQNALVAPGFSARRGALGGDPPVPLEPGESLSMNWTGCTPNAIGIAFIIFEKFVF